MDKQHVTELWDKAVSELGAHIEQPPSDVDINVYEYANTERDFSVTVIREKYDADGMIILIRPANPEHDMMYLKIIGKIADSECVMVRARRPSVRNEHTDPELRKQP